MDNQREHQTSGGMKMLDWIGEWVSKQKGWQIGVAVAGGAVVAGWFWNIPPLNTASSEILILSIVACLFGCTMILVGLFLRLHPPLSAWTKRTLQRRRVRRRQAAPLDQLNRLTVEEKTALAWLLASPRQVDATMVSPFKGLVESGFLVPQTEYQPHRERAMLLSSESIAAKQEIFTALKIGEAGISNLKRKPAPWTGGQRWMLG